MKKRLLILMTLLAAVATGAWAQFSVSVTFVNTQDWDKVYAYSWSTDYSFSMEWPGEQLTKTTRQVDGHDVYVWNFSSTRTGTSAPDMIIFSGGGSQTPDLEFVDGACYDAGGIRPDDHPVNEVDYYVVGSMNDWGVNEAYKMTLKSASNPTEYQLTLSLTTQSQFKVVGVDGGSQTWYPEGMGNNYGENGEITADGDYTILFRPNGDGGDDWFYNYIFVTDDTPVNEVSYYLIGNLKGLDITERSLKFVANPDVAGEYVLQGVFLEEDEEIKVRSSEDKWYNDGGSYYQITTAGIYDLYFNPNGNSAWDYWYMNAEYKGQRSKYIAIVYCEAFGDDDASRNKELYFDESGVLTYNFPAASYVFVRNYDTGTQYCTNGWSNFENPVTLINEKDLTQYFDKFYVPSGSHTLYLHDNGDDTFTISYDKDIRPADGVIEWTAANQGYANQQELTEITIAEGVTGTVSQGSGSAIPKYYTDDTSLRMYGGNTLTISSRQRMTKVVITMTGTEKQMKLEASTGSYSFADGKGTWTGEATGITFSVPSVSGVQARIQKIEIAFAEAPTADVELTLKTGMTSDDFTQEQQVAIGAICIVALNSQGTADAWNYSTKDGKRLFEMSKTDGTVKVYDGVSEADNFTYELTEEDRNTLSGYFSSPGSPTLAEILASVKTITVKFIANEPAPGLAKDEEGYYLIGNADDWQTFVEIVETEPTAKGKLTADVAVEGNAMVGTVDNYYAGTFDGQGHTLTVNYDLTNVAYSQDSRVAHAAFRFISNATIRNLHVDGTIRTSTKFTGGVVGDVHGTNNLIEGCRSSVAITSSVGSDACIGGIASHAPGGGITIRDCLFDGSIIAPSAWGTGGMVGFKNGPGTFENCLFAPTEVNVYQSSTYCFVRSGGGALTLTNCYYATRLGSAQGTQATEDELADGTTAIALQANRDEEIWVLSLLTNLPILKVFADEGTYTAIDAAVNPQSLAQDAQSYYSLDGRRINGVPSQKGIYIINGKKVMVK